MTKQSLEIIHSLFHSKFYPTSDQHSTDTNSPVQLPPLVTISRTLGCHGSEIGTLLAERLGVQLYDRELLNTIVKEAKADKHLMTNLDERVTTMVDELVNAFFAKKSTSRDTFYRYMVKVILGISQTGGVIIGRAAHLVIPAHRPFFRVHLDASPKSCLKNVMQRENIKKNKAEKLIAETNKQRIKFAEKIQQRYPTARENLFDLALNTDTFTLEQSVNVIVSAMKEAGHTIADKA
ncbi:MAG: cytidylate kinase-like family protein [Magnetococcus sp. DMHC-6]